MAVGGLRPPERHGEFLAVPPLDQAQTLLDANRAILHQPRPFLGDRPLAELRQEALHEAVQAARSYAREHRFDLPQHAPTSLIVTGHQPELFHPGVWAKNFATALLARRLGCGGMNVIVDNDVVKTPLLRLPRLWDGRWLASLCPFDRPAGNVPYEEAPVQDEPLLASLPRRVAEAAADWPFRPLLEEYWSALGQSDRLGERLAAGRHRLEERWGWCNLEVPLSRLARTRSFARFCRHILQHLPRFWEACNAELAAFRIRRRVTDPNRPIPDLHRHDDWLEAPFWVWSSQMPQRQRLYVRRRGSKLELAAETVPLAEVEGDELEAWLLASPSPASSGWKLRSRALTTTLFLRLFLADLFVHGIGGAVYDEVTDGIVQRFCGLEPPRFLTLTATLRLPFAGCAQTRGQAEAAVRHLRQCRRRLWYQPERYLTDRGDPLLQQLLDRKRHWIEQQPREAKQRRQRWRQLQEATAALREYVTSQAQAVQQELDRQEQLLAQHEVQCHREYAFCLHPKESIQQLIASLEQAIG
jgi:hypothetical protein